MDKFSIIDEVLKWSKIIEEATLTRYKVQPIKDHHKMYRKRYYFGEGRLPNEVVNFKAFGRKTDRVRGDVLDLPRSC